MTESEQSFGSWLKQRRKALGLTQHELAGRVCCAVITLQKIEADERRPSKQIAGLLAEHLGIPDEERDAFIGFARSPEISRRIAFRAGWRLSAHPLAHLPTPATRLIGRENDIAQVRRRVVMEGCRLLTLVGAPGAGKTRLAIAAAASLANEFDGVCFVELAAIRDPAQVPAAIAQSLRVSETAQQTIAERLVAYLREEELLLLLDNFEQVSGAAPFVAELIESCPWLSIVVTSRAPLRIQAERRYVVGPLALPQAGDRVSEPEELLLYPATALFVERSRDAGADFELTAETAEAVAALCTHLDGLPLAIELVASHASVLPPQVLLRRLSGDLLLHADGLRDAAPRHRTLAGAIAWSYDLLPPDAQYLLRSCSVCVDGWLLEAAEALMGGDRKATLQALLPLVEGNLVVRRNGGSESRFALLETIRAFALERLVESGEEAAIRKRHAESCLALAEEANRGLHSAGQLLWLQRLESERGNLRAALAWFFELGAEPARGARLASALVWFWLMRSRLSEGWEWLNRALACRGEAEPVEPASIARVLLGVGAIAWQRGDLATARRLFAEGAGCYRGLGPSARGELAWALTGLSMVASFQVDLETAQAAADESLAQAEASGDPWVLALALNPVAETCMLRHDYAAARTFLERSLALFRQVGDKWGVALPLLNKGYMDALLGDGVAARAQLEESIVLCRELDEMDTRSRALAILAGVAQQEGNLAEAAALYDESLDLLRKMGLEEGCAETLFHLARLTEAQGHDRLATKLYKDCLALFERQGNEAGIQRCRAKLPARVGK